MRGGERPAVTDADLILGRLDPTNFAGGSIALDPALSAGALEALVAERDDFDVTTAAFGVSEVVDENMANAARVHAVENGEDLAEYTMIAFGGAAPLHAGRLCEKLGINRLIVPPGAGVGSAIGFLRAPYSFEATRSVYMRLDRYDEAAAREIFAALRDEARGFVLNCDAGATVLADHKLYMRYVGQGWEIPVALTADEAAQPTAETLKALFEAEYASLFGRTVAGLTIEITVWAVNATTPQAKVSPTAAAARHTPAKEDGRRRLFSPSQNAEVEAPVVAREALPDGARVIGPAIVTEAETTIIVPAGYAATGRADGCIDVEKLS